MRQSRVQKGARSKAQPPVVGRPVEISRPKRRAHSQIVKTCRTEIRLRGCRRPRNTDSGLANDPRTSCAPCRRTPAAPTTRNRHSKKPEDCARAGLGRRQRRAIRLKARQEFLNAWSADLTFKKENVERPTPNAQRRTRKGCASFGIPFGRPDTGNENPDQFVDFIRTGYEVRR
jgi:hypothetical protein